MPNTKPLSERLRQLRIRAGLEPYELADKAGIARSTISKIESGVQGNVRADTAMRLARALGCDPAELLGEAPIIPRIVREPVEELGEGWEIADMPRLIAEYVASRWYAHDTPTPEEMQWLTSFPGLPYPSGTPRPNAGTLHKLLALRRLGRL